MSESQEALNRLAREFARVGTDPLLADDNGAMSDWEPHPSLPDTFQRFVCDPPPEGVAFRVLREEWDEDYTHRTIYEVQLIDSGDDA